MTTTKSGLQYEDTKVGEGQEAKKGDTVEVHYTGTLENGKQFDSSRGRGSFSFTIGGGMVIAGWEEGLQGMKVGGTRTLVIPFQLAYGEAGYPGAIPPRATLNFDIELLSIE